MGWFSCKLWTGKTRCLQWSRAGKSLRPQMGFTHSLGNPKWKTEPYHLKFQSCVFGSSVWKPDDSKHNLTYMSVYMLNISLFWPEKYHYNLISHLLHCILRLAMDLPSLRSPYLVQEPLQVASWPWGDPKISSLLGKRRIFHMGYKATPA